MLLSSCADTRLPPWLTGEPDDGVLNAPRVVGVPPSAHDTSFPNLSTVPDKPQDYSPKSVRDEMIGVMQDDKDEAHEVRERLEAIPSPEAAPSLPPPPMGSFLQPPGAPQQGIKP